MDIGPWLLACTLVATLGYGTIGIKRSSLLDQISVLEKKHSDCERQLSDIRTEITWMRHNMIFKMQPPGESA